MLLLHSDVIRASVVLYTTSPAAADDDDGSRCDVIARHPEHLLLISLGTCSTTRFVCACLYVVVMILRN